MPGWTIEQWAVLGAWALFAMAAQVWSVLARRRMDRGHRELMREIRRVVPPGRTKDGEEI